MVYIFFLFDCFIYVCLKKKYVITFVLFENKKKKDKKKS